MVENDVPSILVVEGSYGVSHLTYTSENERYMVWCVCERETEVVMTWLANMSTHM